MLSDPLRFSSFQAQALEFQSFSLQEVVNKSQIKKFIPKIFGLPPNDRLKEGPWH